MKLTKHEKRMIQSMRAYALTGYPIHERDNLYYVWSMGGQPLEPLLASTPKEAATLFLNFYKKRDKGQFHDTSQPIAK